MKARRRGAGRPPAGPHGEKVSQYPQLTIRLPAESKARLNTMSLLLGRPIWRIVDDAIEVYVTHLPEPDRSRLGEIAQRLVRGDWPVTSHWDAMWGARRGRKPGGSLDRDRAATERQKRAR